MPQVETVARIRLKKPDRQQVFYADQIRVLDTLTKTDLVEDDLSGPGGIRAFGIGQETHSDWVPLSVGLEKIPYIQILVQDLLAQSSQAQQEYSLTVYLLLEVEEGEEEN